MAVSLKQGIFVQTPLILEKKESKLIVVKVGSNVISELHGGPNKERIQQIVKQIQTLRKQGTKVVLVSSGAVASGRAMVNLPEKIDPISRRQILSSIGQVKLLDLYNDYFGQFDVHCAQVLVTQNDFRDRNHYLNIQNCLSALLQYDVLPIVNENDTVSITELMFTDNDELAGLIATLVNADQLIILSNVDGIYTGNPNDASSQLIEKVKEGQDFSSFISSDKSSFGRGGMLTKANLATKMADLGIDVCIANGKKENILLDLMDGNAKGTFFEAKKKKAPTKQWIATSEKFSKGKIFINEGAKKALLENDAASLLPVGVIKIEGDFEPKDIVSVVDENGEAIALGRVDYGTDKATEVIGENGHKPLIHYNYLYIK